MNTLVVNSIGADKGLRNRLSVRELHARLPLETKKKKGLETRPQGASLNKVLMPFTPMSQYLCSILSVLEECRETPVINDLQLL